MLNYVQISSYAGLQLKGEILLWSESMYVIVFVLQWAAAAYKSISYLLIQVAL